MSTSLLANGLKAGTDNFHSSQLQDLRIGTDVILENAEVAKAELRSEIKLILEEQRREREERFRTQQGKGDFTLLCPYLKFMIKI